MTGTTTHASASMRIIETSIVHGDRGMMTGIEELREESQRTGIMKKRRIKDQDTLNTTVIQKDIMTAVMRMIDVRAEKGDRMADIDDQGPHLIPLLAHAIHHLDQVDSTNLQDIDTDLILPGKFHAARNDKGVTGEVRLIGNECGKEVNLLLKIQILWRQS